MGHPTGYLVPLQVCHPAQLDLRVAQRCGSAHPLSSARRSLPYYRWQWIQCCPRLRRRRRSRRGAHRGGLRAGRAGGGGADSLPGGPPVLRLPRIPLHVDCKRCQPLSESARVVNI